MISTTYRALAFPNHDADFTVEHYRDLLRLARQKWPLVSYDAIPFGQRFLLWRHDCDYSLNRALALARIEQEEGVQATYFINPHSEFYNPLERGQLDILLQIREMGHHLALHFDSMFFTTHDELELVRQLESEASLLEAFLGERPVAFSFHNPSTFHLSCEAENYAGMVNCYSRRFKKKVAYCSDSNGYWRFQRLYDVLARGEETKLQVLTHPGWWQDEPMPPREKVFRSVYGRAEATLRFFYKAIEDGGRENPSSVRRELAFLQPLQPRAFVLCDYLWGQGFFAALFVELWRLHERQINQLCMAVFRKDWGVPAAEVNAFFEDRRLAIDGWRLLKVVLGATLQEVAGINEGDYEVHVDIRNSLIHGCSFAHRKQMEDGCIFLCSAIEALVTWGNSQPMAYDGISHLDSIGILTYKTADVSLTDKLEEIADEIPSLPGKRWERFKADMQKVGVGRATE